MKSSVIKTQKSIPTMDSYTSVKRFELLTTKNQGFPRRRSDFKILKYKSVISLNEKLSMAKMRSTISQRSSKLANWQRERESSLSEKSLQQLQVNMDQFSKSSLNDSVDISIHPTYNLMQFHYDLICYLRYREAKELYEKTFQREIQQMIDNQPTVYQQLIAKIPFQYTTLWPPLHSKSEIEFFQRNFFKLNPKEKRRLDYLMSTKII